MSNLEQRMERLRDEAAQIDHLLVKADNLLWWASVLLGVVIFNAIIWAGVLWVGA